MAFFFFLRRNKINKKYGLKAYSFYDEKVELRTLIHATIVKDDLPLLNEFFPFLTKRSFVFEKLYTNNWCFSVLFFPLISLQFLFIKLLAHFHDFILKHLRKILHCFYSFIIYTVTARLTVVIRTVFFHINTNTQIWFFGIRESTLFCTNVHF